MTRVAIISQARMTSSRLPGKVLLEANGKSMLAHHIERLQASGFPVIVATTTNETDAPVVDAAEALGSRVFRGSESDVLSRYAEAARANDLDVLVRVTSDCPLIDGELIERGIGQFLEAQNPFLYVSNTQERTFPRGFDFEIMSVDRLYAAEDAATLRYQREHVTPWIYESRDTEIRQVVREEDASAMRVTLDTPEDLKLLVTLFEEYDAAQLGCEAIIALLSTNPELVALNSHVEQKKLTS